jgi:hypothetical protein
MLLGLPSFLQARPGEFSLLLFFSKFSVTVADPRNRAYCNGALIRVDGGSSLLAKI